MAAAAMVTSLATPTVAQDTDLPKAPTGLRATAPSHDLVRLTWRNPGDSSITGYEISRHEGNSGTTGFTVIESDTGKATTYEDRNVEAGTAYHYSIKARNEHGLSDRSTDPLDVYVRVPSAPDPRPSVTGNTAVIYSENGSKTVASYRARSSSSPITWSLTGADAGEFSISTRGVLTFITPPDYETPTDGGGDRDYELTVTATDGQNRPGTLNVVVTVINVDEPPDLSQTGSVEEQTRVDDYAENQADTTVVASYTATDPENPDSSEIISWSLSGADRDDFTISSGGVLRFAASPDFETPTDSNRDNQYEVTVVASDGAKTASRSVWVAVKSVEEPGMVTLSSTQPVVGVTLTATLSDPDVPLRDIKWQWQKPGTDPWEDIPGANSASFRPRADDEGASLRVSVKYSDSHSPKTLTEEAGESVQPRRSGNQKPVFDAGSFTWEVAEDTASDTDVGDPVAATDPDDNSPLIYRLSGADAGSFTIDPSGQIKTGAALDYETKRTYRVNVVATDSSNASRSVPVTINVTDVEEPLSEVTGDTEVSYDEGRSDPVATYSATDPDGHRVTWSLSGTADAGKFGISTRGVLTFDTPPDHEKPTDTDEGNTYAVTVTASSEGDTSTSVDVTVTVTDVDEPLVLTGDNSPSFPENRDFTTPVDTYTATDPEMEPVVWTLEGVDREFFTIDGGELKFKASPDYENPTDRGRNRSYNVTVVASTMAHTAKQNVTVAVTNVNEEGPLVFSAKQPQVGTPLTATLTDPDKHSVRWKWETSTDTDIWSTRARSATYTPRPADVGRTLRVEATYTDAFGSQTLTSSDLSVVAASGTNPPVFEPPDVRHHRVGEDTLVGTLVGTVTPTSTPDTLSYRLSGADAGSFTIDSSGQITTRVALDYETKRTYRVNVVAINSSGSDQQKVTITVTNMGEDGTVTLSGGSPKVGARLTATLTDPDGDIDGLTWQWFHSTARGGPWTSIFAATSATYTPTGAHTGRYLRAVASYTDGFAPNAADTTAEAVTLQVVEMAQQQRVTDPEDDIEDDTDSSTRSGSGSGTTRGTDPEPDPADDRAFSDISDHSLSHQGVRRLAEEGVLDGTGCGGGRLCPSGGLLRWEMAVWLVRILDGDDPPQPRRSGFVDVDADVWWSAHVERLADLGITEGCAAEPLSYCPYTRVTRAQMASFLVRAFDLPPAQPAGFVDVTGDGVHDRNIDAIYAAEITVGCMSSPLTYCPGRYTTRAQMARFLVRGR